MSRTGKVRPKSGAHVAYYRVSDVKQGESGLGLDAQRAAVARYLSQIHGTLVAEYTEVESGKKHTNRPQLLAAIASSKKHGATLVIAKLDRLARNVHFISGLMEAAADFVACDMPEANKLTLHIMAAMAEHEREAISKRTKDALEQAKQRGTKLGNPQWREALDAANLAKRSPQEKAAQASDVAKGLITQMRTDGKSLREIAAKLNEAGLKTRTGAQWHASSVRAAA